MDHGDRSMTESGEAGYLAYHSQECPGIIAQRRLRILDKDQKPATSINHQMAALNHIERWLQLPPRSEQRVIEEIPPKDLDAYLADFFTMAKKHDGSEFGATYFERMRSSLERHLREHGYSHSIVKSAVFAASQRAYKSKMVALRVAMFAAKEQKT